MGSIDGIQGRLGRGALLLGCFCGVFFGSVVMSSAAQKSALWTSCTTGDAIGQCSIPRGIGGDPNLPGHVYVSDQANARINEFTAWGEFVKAWGWGVRSEAPESQVCSSLTGCVAGISGDGPGQFDSPQGVAVDSAGDIYVVDKNNFRVEKFDSDGHFLLMFGGGVDQGPNHPGNLCTAAYVAEGDTCGTGTSGAVVGEFGDWAVGSNIAAGNDGTIYVGDRSRIQEFSLDGAYIKSVPLPGELVQSLAVDPVGNLYVGRYENLTSSKDNILKLSPNGDTICTITVDNPGAIAASIAGDVYVVHNIVVGAPGDQAEVLEFPSDCGDVIDRFGEGEIASSTGIAEGGACFTDGADVYVSNSRQTGAFVRAYGPPPDNVAACEPPKNPPTIDSQYAVSVDSNGATVRAQINPQFWADTRYYVQFGTLECVSGGWEKGCVRTQPAAPGSLLTSKVFNGDLTSAGVFLTGLEANTTYRYRFVAQSTGGGPVFGMGGKVGAAGEEATFITSLLPEAQDFCTKNESFRVAASAALPDCRAYEMVSPVDKENGDIATLLNLSLLPARLDQSSLMGDKITYSSYRSFANGSSAPWSSQYVASRDASVGWLTKPISPPREGATFGSSPLNREYQAFSLDLCRGWLLHYNEPPLAPGAPGGFTNLYSRQNCAREVYEPLIGVEPAVKSSLFPPELQGMSADGSRAIFRIEEPLAVSEGPEAAPGNVFQLYESYDGGRLRLVSVLPNGTASKQQGSAGSASGGFANTHSLEHAISADGSRIYWSASTAPRKSTGKIYLRINGETTVPVSSEPAQFWTAARDGSKAIFSISGGALADNLYEFSADTKSTARIAGEVRGVLGASEDASRIYFVSGEVLSGEEENSAGAKAKAAAPNLYLYEASEAGGGFTFVATLSSYDAQTQSQHGAEPTPINLYPNLRSSRVTPDGQQATFMSTASLTGFDNTDANSDEADAEVFIYDATAEGSDGELLCVSCNRTGVRPSGANVVSESQGDPVWAAAHIPGWQDQLYAPRILSEDGKRLFFESFEALVHGDTNGTQDIYEWERAGTGGCLAASTTFVNAAGGCIRLISSGESPSESEFIDANTSGSDVFFTTAQSLLPQDPGLIDIYDARENGGFPAPPSPRAPCEGGACQSPPPAPNDPTPSSTTFQGPGNQHQAKKHKKKPKKQKKHSKSKKKNASKSGRAHR